MKRTWVCPKCKGRRIGYFEWLPDVEQEKKHAKFTLRRNVGAEQGVGYILWGELEAYVCGDCGYLEEYVKDPNRVPWERLRNFRWLTPPDETPYR